MNCGGKIKMKSGGKSYPKAVTKSAYSTTTPKKANLSKTLAGMRKGEEGMITRKGVKDVIKYASRVEPRGIATAPMGMPAAPNTIESPANWYNESSWDNAQKENAARPVANAPATPATTKGGSEKVRAYQEMLRSKGYDIAADGAWGPKTQKAYEAYIKSKTTAVKTVAKPVAKAAAAKTPVQAKNPYLNVKTTSGKQAVPMAKKNVKVTPLVVPGYVDLGSGY
jgi:hypothetical protein